uniref:C6 domain-containing protein n=1 Tax=Plectus sambesii TaxID=2011161 RepID=A0A914VIE1_9BILA
MPVRLVAFFILTALLITFVITPVDLCQRTAVLPETASTTPVISTTTAITACPSAEPLFSIVEFTPGERRVNFVPASTAPVGSSIVANCVGSTPTSPNTAFYITYDSIAATLKQNANNFPATGGIFEQVTLTCTPSGLWNVASITATGPVSDIISVPNSIICFA